MIPIENPTVGSSAPLPDNPFCPPTWGPPIDSHSVGYSKAKNPFSAPGDLSPYSLGSEFIIQAPMPLRMNDKTNEKRLSSESEEAEFSGQCVQEESSSKGVGFKKRKRGGGAQGDKSYESNEARQSSAKENAKIKPRGVKKGALISKNVEEGSQGSDLPKEEYMHVRARRGQATNSHSLAERVRREKISERMTFLQDLVPGCNKVTGKAVMLNEIINYVQSLQRQVEFLSMKLATVNPCLDFNIEGLLAKDVMSQHRGSMFPSEMTMPFPSLHHPSESLRRPIDLSNGFNEPTSQLLSEWEDELHSIVHMGVNSSAPLHSQDITGSISPAHTKAEP